MHRESASMILRQKGREPWEVKVLVSFLEQSGALGTLHDDADHEDLSDAAGAVFSHGPDTAAELQKIREAARRDRLIQKQAHLNSLVQSICDDRSEFTPDEIEERVAQLAVVESHLARVGVPQDLVVPIAGLLQAADCSLSPSDTTAHVRLALHQAAKRLLQFMPT